MICCRCHTRLKRSGVTLAAEIELPSGVHVYSPGVNGYKPIQMQLQPRSGIELSDPTYPDSKILYLEAIQESVPVFEGKFRITQDATVIPSEALDVARSLVGTQKTISITGELRYQACDKAICYPPASVPLKWQLQILPLDLKRSPKGIRHK